jgi:hypothetical protein
MQVNSQKWTLVNNKDQYKVYSKSHGTNNRQSSNLHQPSPNLAKYQKGIYYPGIKVFNNLPLHIKNLSENTKQFKSALKSFFYTNYFYSFHDYFNTNKE